MEQLKIQKKWLIIAASVLAALCIVYFGVAMFLTDRFLPRTTINGIHCFGKTAEAVEMELKETIDGYVLQITDINGNVEEKTAQDFGMAYVSNSEIVELQESQNPYKWVFSLFKGQTIEIEVDFNYNQESLDEAISSLNCMKEENQVAPVSAKLTYESGTFVIGDEVNGSQIDKEVMQSVMKESVESLETSVNLEEKGCYIKPTYTAESEEVLAAQKELNKYISTVITYSLDSIVVTVDKDEISQWVSADENMNPVISEEKVKAFTDTLGDHYNTPNQAQTLTTPTGKEVSISGAKKGRIVGSKSECEKLMEEIKAGTVTTRSPILSQEATPDGEFGWGTTYIEVDISQQHMWYIVNGEVVFETDIVTGKPGNDTPTGMFEILTKKRDKVLRGRPLANGKPSYITPVSYWARVTWSGIGFHDATWQAKFGGQRYLEGYGSHGCINMPFSAVKEFYSMISVGDTVVIHK